VLFGFVLMHTSVADFASVKEWHFHTYFDEKDSASVGRALAFRDGIVNQKSFVARCLAVNMGPRGPHPCGSFETWVSQEHFATAFAFFVQCRGEFDIFVHALTVLEVLDHKQGVWMGTPKVLNFGALKDSYPT
jgi:DOPA 4,5-dioxygenase